MYVPDNIRRNTKKNESAGVVGHALWGLGGIAPRSGQRGGGRNERAIKLPYNERKQNGRKNAPEMQIIATNGDKHIAKMDDDYFISWPVRV